MAPPQRREVKFVTPDEVERLAEARGLQTWPKWRGVLSRGQVTGQPADDLRALLSSMLATHLLLRGRPGPEELVFVAPNGGAAPRWQLPQAHLAPAVKAAGLEGSPSKGCGTQPPRQPEC